MTALTLILLAIGPQAKLTPVLLEAEVPSAGLNHSLELAESLKLDLATDQVRAIKMLRDYRAVFDTDGFASGQGLIWYLTERGELKSVNYWTVPSVERYYDFVESEIRRRGGETDIEPTTHRKVRLTTRDASIPDAWSNYHDGLCVVGYSSEVHRIPLENASRWAKAANGKQSSALLQIAAIPEDTLSRIFKRVRSDLDVSLQRRDNEGDLQHLVRKTKTEQSIALLEMIA